MTVPIKCIREIRQGKNTELLKSPDLVDTYSEDCSFSIMVGEDFESIDLIAASSEEANVWITGLNFLIGLAKCKFIFIHAHSYSHSYSDSDSLPHWELDSFTKFYHNSLSLF